MQLNLINKTTIVAGAVTDPSVNPRHGQIVALGGGVFKFIPQGLPEAAMLIERVDLGELFKGIPQDISGFAEMTQLPVSSTRVLAAMEFPVDTLEPPLVEDLQDLTRATDNAGFWFQVWCEWVGVRDLPRSEVVLGVIDDQLIVDASRARLYKGQMSITIKV